jgi:antitoxin CcdA
MSDTFNPQVHAPTEQLNAGERAEWLRDNADAIHRQHAWNQYVETNGTFSDSVRKF